jgi:hypothetical protein
VEPVNVALAVAVVVVGAIATYLDQPKRRQRSAPKAASHQKNGAFVNADDRAFYAALRPVEESEGLAILANSGARESQSPQTMCRTAVGSPASLECEHRPRRRRPGTAPRGLPWPFPESSQRRRETGHHARIVLRPVGCEPPRAGRSSRA